MRCVISKNSILALWISMVVLSCSNNESSRQQDTGSPQETASSIPEPAGITYTIVNTYPHDTAAFTQGLEFYKGILLESTGLEGRSSLRKVDLASGKPTVLKKLDKAIFGEGITVLNDTLYQLTWENHIVFVYDPKDFRQIRQMSWSYEGWGITNNGKSLFITDGSDKIYQVRPNDLKLERVISVSDNLGPLNNLNELEYVNGHIYANRLDYNYIVRIDPSNGHVTGRADFTDVLKKYSKMDLTYIEKDVHGAVLNGIAWDPAKKKMYVTGKLWPLMFELQMEP